MATGTIRVGIGGWVFPDWRDNFYPKGLPQKQELHFAARALTAIEINATYHRLQSPDSFRRWAGETPDGFVFAIKGSRYVTNRKDLGTAGESIAKFMEQGLAELGERLGPINWQLAATKRFDPDEIARFCDLLPSALNGLPLRHAIEARHESFADPAFAALLGERDIAIVQADSPKFPALADSGAGFVYARLMDAQAGCPTGYDAAALDRFAAQARDWAKGPRDVFVFFINGAKERAPAAAQALIGRL